MASASVYNSYKNNALSGSVALLTDTIKVALVGSGYTPNIDTDQFFSAVSANEIVVSGYTAGGLALTTKSITTDLTNDRAYLDADDAIWTAGGTFTVRYAVIYKSTGTNSTSPLIGYVNFITDRTALTGELFTIQWAAPASGAILYLA